MHRVTLPAAWIGLDNPSGMPADHHPDIGACPAS
jgi:hypothetical protein